MIFNNHVIFDQDVSIVLGEGTRCEIGPDCIFAKGVRIRTCDQYFIYDSENNRINTSKAIINRKTCMVWCSCNYNERGFNRKRFCDRDGCYGDKGFSR